MSELDQLRKLIVDISYENKEVILSSGEKSPFYIDLKQTSLHPVGMDLIGRLLFKKIMDCFPETKAVGGLTLGADPLIMAVALTSVKEKRPLKAFMIRKEPKKHGTMAYIEGEKNLAKGMAVVLLEDVMTSGLSLITALERSNSFGLHVIGVLVIVDRGEGGRGKIESRGIRFERLFDLEDLKKG